MVYLKNISIETLHKEDTEDDDDHDDNNSNNNNNNSMPKIGKRTIYKETW
jgi:hypothetical protein